MLSLQEAARGSCCFTNPASRVYIKTKQEGSRQLACLWWNSKIRAILWGKASQKLRLTTALSVTSQTVVQSQPSGTPNPDLLHWKKCLPAFNMLVQQLVKTPNLWFIQFWPFKWDTKVLVLILRKNKKTSLEKSIPLISFRCKIQQ